MEYPQLYMANHLDVGRWCLSSSGSRHGRHGTSGTGGGTCQGCVGQSGHRRRNGDFTDIGNLPSGDVKIAIENGTFIVDLPIENGDVP